MDEPVKVKYVPVEVVKEYIKQVAWLTADFDEMVKKYGIEVVRYKNAISISDYEMRAIEACADWMSVVDFVKEHMASQLEDAINVHAKCTHKEYFPMERRTEYRYAIMIGEIPKWQQKGEDDEQRN